MTTLATVPETACSPCSHGRAREIGAAGLPLAAAAFRELVLAVMIQETSQDGQSLQPGHPLMLVDGPARAVLTAERVALNFVQRLSGIATLTAQFVQAVAGTRTRILDTRKTTPGWRQLEKYAVHCGGGSNHRLGLYDMVLIKDNHLAAIRDEPPNAIEAGRAASARLVSGIAGRGRNRHSGASAAGLGPPVRTSFSWTTWIWNNFGSGAIGRRQRQDGGERRGHPKKRPRHR